MSEDEQKADNAGDKERTYQTNTAPTSGEGKPHVSQGDGGTDDPGSKKEVESDSDRSHGDTLARPHSHPPLLN